MSGYAKEKEAKFLNYWESKRENKGKMYLQTLLIWGLISSNLTYFIIIRFALEDFIWADYGIMLLIWCLAAPLFTFMKIRTQEKQYKKLTQS